MKKGEPVWKDRTLSLQVLLGCLFMCDDIFTRCLFCWRSCSKCKTEEGEKEEYLKVRGRNWDVPGGKIHVYHLHIFINPDATVSPLHSCSSVKLPLVHPWYFTFGQDDWLLSWLEIYRSLSLVDFSSSPEQAYLHLWQVWWTASVCQASVSS